MSLRVIHPPTMHMTTSHSVQRTHALSLLLGRYIAGEIAEAQFTDVNDLLDDTNATSEERAAFARFYLDALSYDGEVKLPKPEELNDILTIARA